VATKKQNRRTKVRSARRALNRTIGDVKWTRKGFLGSRHGAGVLARNLRIRDDRDDDT
jgi:hypothetical protein